MLWRTVAADALCSRDTQSLRSTQPFAAVTPVVFCFVFLKKKVNKAILKCPLPLSHFISYIRVSHVSSRALLSRLMEHTLLIFELDKASDLFRLCSVSSSVTPRFLAGEITQDRIKSKFYILSVTCLLLFYCTLASLHWNCCVCRGPFLKKNLTTYHVLQTQTMLIDRQQSSIPSCHLLKLVWMWLKISSQPKFNSIT